MSIVIIISAIILTYIIIRIYMPTFRDNLHLGEKDPLIDADSIADGSITTDKLADDAVTNAKLACDSVGSCQIQEGAVGLEHLTEGARNAMGGTDERVAPLIERVDAISTKLNGLETDYHRDINDADVRFGEIEESMVKSVSVNGGQKVMPNWQGNVNLLLPSPVEGSDDTDWSSAINSLQYDVQTLQNKVGNDGQSSQTSILTRLGTLESHYNNVVTPSLIELAGYIDGISVADQIGAAENRWSNDIDRVEDKAKEAMNRVVFLAFNQQEEPTEEQVEQINNSMNLFRGIFWYTVDDDTPLIYRSTIYDIHPDGDITEPWEERIDLLNSDNLFVDLTNNKLCTFDISRGKLVDILDNGMLRDSEHDFAIQDEDGNIILSVHGGHIATKHFDSRDITKKRIKILAFGNDYSCDAYAYVPALLERMGFDVTFGILNSDGCTIGPSAVNVQSHWDKFYSENPAKNGPYDFIHIYESSTGTWSTNTMDATPDVALAYTDWDIITLQQADQYANDSTSIMTYLNDVINAISSSDYLQGGVKFGWLLTPLRSYQTDKETYIQNQLAAIEDIMSDTIVEFVIPCGIAIANARTNESLANLGNVQYLTYDDVHLQEGLPRLIEAYVAAATFASMAGCGYKGIIGHKFRPTDDWLADTNIPSQHGKVLSYGITDEHYLLGQKSAVMALKNPTEVTTINS